MIRCRGVLGLAMGGTMMGVSSLPNPPELVELGVSEGPLTYSASPPPYDELRKSLAAARFHMDKKHAYETTQIDDFLDDLTTRLDRASTDQVEHASLLELVRTVRFSVARRVGYSMIDVDEFLETIAARLA